MIPIVELRGSKLVRVSVNASDLVSAAEYEPPNGVYLVARTYKGGQELLLDEHMDRMERSAEVLGHTLVIPRERIRRVLTDLLASSGFGEGRFRVTAVLENPVWYRVSMELAGNIPLELLAHGVRCSLWEGGARKNATVKSTAWMHRRAHAPRAPEVYERLLVDREGRVLEGAGSNVYFVVAGALRTAGEGVLAGIARRIVLEVSESILPVELVALRKEELGNAEEAFLSSATRGVVPIRSVDRVEYGDPGPATRAITEAYDRRVAALLRPLGGQ